MRKLAAALAFAGLLAGGCAGGGGGPHTIAAEFTDVGDLVVRANVQQSDAVVGTVRNIDLVERSGEWIARVEMQIDEKTRVQQGTRAVVRATSLLGERYVDLMPPERDAPELREGGVIPRTHTAKAPDLEALFSELGSILETDALQNLAKLTSAGAMILERQEESTGRVLDGTAKLLASLRAQKDALASGLADLASASKTLASRSDTLERALDVSDDALAVLVAQQRELDQVVVQLDHLAAPLARLTRAHKGDIDAQVKALNKAVPALYEVRTTLGRAIEKLPEFTRLFARAVPGDYVQLDVHVEGSPFGTPTSGPSRASSIGGFFLEATR